MKNGFEKVVIFLGVSLSIDAYAWSYNLVQDMGVNGVYRYSRFGSRMRGEGAFADLLAQRFALARRRLGLERRDFELDSSQFAPPGRQLALL